MCLSIYRNKRLIKVIGQSHTLADLAAHCNGELIGDGQHVITGLCSLESQFDDGLTFITTNALTKHIEAESNTSYIVKPEWRDLVNQGIVHDNPTQAFRLIAELFSQSDKPAKIATSAVIAESAMINNDVAIGENTVIGDDVVIESGCKIGANTIIESNCVIGENTVIDHNVILYDMTLIGSHCRIKSGAVLGGQGFGFSFEGGQWKAIPQLGKVQIGNACHIGANSCIDRGAINDTIIEDNVIIDNQVHIAHNVKIGAHTAMAAGVGIAGSTTVGRYCLLGGQVGVVGHINICDGVQVNGGARILQSITEPGAYSGSFSVMPSNKWNRAMVYFKRLETLFKTGKNSD